GPASDGRAGARRETCRRSGPLRTVISTRDPESNRANRFRTSSDDNDMPVPPSRPPRTVDPAGHPLSRPAAVTRSILSVPGSGVPHSGGTQRREESPPVGAIESAIAKLRDLIASGELEPG